jgi:hypothetical protein
MVPSSQTFDYSDPQVVSDCLAIIGTEAPFLPRERFKTILDNAFLFTVKRGDRRTSVVLEEARGIIDILKQARASSHSVDGRNPDVVYALLKSGGRVYICFRRFVASLGGRVPLIACQDQAILYPNGFRVDDGYDPRLSFVVEERRRDASHLFMGDLDVEEVREVYPESFLFFGKEALGMRRFFDPDNFGLPKSERGPLRTGDMVALSPEAGASLYWM